MKEPVQQSDLIRVAVKGGVALIVVRGRGSFKMGPALKEFCLAAHARGARLFILDMDQCIGMDSTFMGVLAGIALKTRTGAGRGVIMMNLHQKTLALLKTLGLDRLIETYEAGVRDENLARHLAEVTDLSQMNLQDAGAEKRVTLETMLNAHRDLVEASPENLPKFQNVLDYLSQDLKSIEEG